jgi:hypothetical protein
LKQWYLTRFILWPGIPSLWLRPVPSYATIRRFLAAHGLTKRRAITRRQTQGALVAKARLEAREVRSFESEFVAGLWHWDGHFGSRKILTPRGE